jgi:hypothetical protein
MIRYAAEVVAGAATVGVAHEFLRIRRFETADDPDTGQNCARESQTGRETSPKRIYVLH